MRENECKLAGCQASCCHDIFFQIPMGKQEILAAFPGAQPINYLEYNSDELDEGVYYHRGFVRIVGPCPNLTESDCLLHEDLIMPQSCKELSRCSDNCVDARRRDSLR